MERRESQSIGDILRMALQENSMQERLDERRAVALWPAIVGDSIAAQCKTPMVKEGILTVGIPNAALRHELLMTRTLLKNAINSAIGKETIIDIRFIS